MNKILELTAKGTSKWLQVKQPYKTSIAAVMVRSLLCKQGELVPVGRGYRGEVVCRVQHPDSLVDQPVFWTELLGSGYLLPDGGHEKCVRRRQQ